MQTNPFDITKADDFSNDDIARLWVDLPVGARIADILEPTSPMPLLVIGGKGSGKTHLMRHASYPLQKLRAQHQLTLPTAENYVGIYFRCSGLNTGRFAGKGQSNEKWQTVFEYFMELWIGQKVLEVVTDILGYTGHGADVHQNFTDALVADIDTDADIRSLAQFLAFLRGEQRKVNYAVNNCPLTERLDVEVKLTRGSLIFGIPRLAADLIPELREVRFLYLVDELEHLLEPHQRYLQTLMRERQHPASFRVGARRYGVSTYETYSAGEVNKRGSEFDEIDLDARMRESPEYPEFARQLAISRLRDAGVIVTPDSSSEREFLYHLFPAPARDLLAFNETEFVRKTWEGRERPYLNKLKAELLQHADATSEDVTGIITLLRCPEYPLIEKTNVFLLYRAWNKGSLDFAKTARRLASETAKTLAGDRDTEQIRILKHWKSDLIAQLYRDCRRPVRYTGFDNFVTMSSGYPRNVLVILKNNIRYATFAEASGLSDAIPARLQDSAVRVSADWFFYDAGIATPEAESIRAAVGRLATLMRAIRYSDLPAECSLSTFAVDRSALTASARNIIEKCVTWSLLIEIPRGHKDKNTEEIASKYQVNPMIAPKWELPLSRRGALELHAALANSIFDHEHANGFERLLEERVAGLNVPFGHTVRRSEQQIQLSGLHD